jgi:ASC-1-like (ASCH) protein
MDIEHNVTYSTILYNLIGVIMTKYKVESAKIHTWKLVPYLLDTIFDGSKSLGVRVKNSRTIRAHIGDFIDFTNQKDTINKPKYLASIKIIVAIREYSSFLSMLEMEPSAKIWPDMSPRKVLEMLRVIYSAEQEKRGVLIFELKSVQ